jgi:hypothetical protein
MPCFPLTQARSPQLSRHVHSITRAHNENHVALLSLEDKLKLSRLPCFTPAISDNKHWDTREFPMATKLCFPKGPAALSKSPAGICGTQKKKTFTDVTKECKQLAA